MQPDKTKIVSAEKKSKKLSLKALLGSAQKIADDAFDEAAATDSIEKFPIETLRKITEQHLLTAALPKQYNGIGLGLEFGNNEALLLILKQLGRGNLVMGRIYEGHVNALLLTNLFGSDEHIKWLAAEVSHGGLSGVWNTQAADGVTLLPLKNGKYRLQGCKIFASGVNFVTHPLVTAALPDGGWQMCIVPLTATQLKTDASWWNPMGMRATRSFKVDFTGIEIDQKQLIGSPGDYYRQPWFSGGAVRFSAVQLGAAVALFEQTRQYLQMLKRIDDPYQKMRLGEMAILIETGNLWLKSAAEKMDDFMDNPSAIQSDIYLAYANMMRTEIENICIKVMSLTEKSVGARGLNHPFHFGRIIRDLTIYLRQPAPDAALAEVGQYVLQSELGVDSLWTR
ncbi:acyl-CoA dehydrogenase family protein [Crenothrix sp.]|uniref:acyl-CoA dehydrogenase family protein n=1 Tax=Crenothrix sp. TaxID=3100433 RepID=UPI00374D6882